ncbi:MAG: methyltransferase domain-containing protein [Verrucomicrobia bacterium]|nr:methyltransferase domain-containing protein [Verrucomicrobiota bacterium]
MKCIICGSESRFYFSKHFRDFGLGTCDYWRCEGCGFTLSKTHAEMEPAEWERINHEVHASYLGTMSDPGDPRWFTRIQQQAAVIHDALSLGFFKQDGRWLDWGCGDGKLSDFVRKTYGLNLNKYDRYIRHAEDYLTDDDLLPGSFDFVITTSVFEHFTRRDEFDSVESLVSRVGVLGCHTLVCECVPSDPAWFYLAPVHCAFHTNRSMEILLKQWGYTCSVYDVAAQVWLCFKTEPRGLEGLVRRANVRTVGRPYVFKEGFVDYWKCTPIRRAIENGELPRKDSLANC